MRPRIESLDPPYYRAAQVLLYVALAAATVYPLFSVEVPPLVDYPNHLARAHVLTNIGEVPALRHNYAVTWSALPNLAMDAVMVPLTAVLPLEEAGRLFAAATLLLSVAAVALLRRAVHGRVGLWPAAAFMLAFNAPFAWGFLSYLFSAALALMLFAGWIATSGWRPAHRFAVFALAALALYFCHLIALAAYGLMVGSHELWRGCQAGRGGLRATIRDWTLGAAQFLLPAIFHLTAPAEFGDALTISGGIGARVSAAFAPLRAIDGQLDMLAFAAGVALLCVGMLTRSLSFKAPLLAPIAVVGAAALAMPSMLMGVWGTHLRLPVVLAALLVAAIELRLPDRRIAWGLAGVGAALTVSRVFAISEAWQPCDRQFVEFRQAARAMEEGAWLLVVYDIDHVGSKLLCGSFNYYRHFPALAVIDRSAFLPSLFSGSTMLQFPREPTASGRGAITAISPSGLRAGATAATAPLPTDAGAADLPADAYWRGWPRRYDYVLWVHFGFPQEQPPQLALRHRGSYFDLYAVVR